MASLPAEEMLLEREYARAYELAERALGSCSSSYNNKSEGDENNARTAAEEGEGEEEEEEEATRASAVLLQAAAEMGRLRAPGAGGEGLRDMIEAAFGGASGRRIPAPITLLWYEN